MVDVAVSVQGPCANPNFLRVRVVTKDLSWIETLVHKPLVKDGFVEARWIRESADAILVELPCAGPDVRIWVRK